MKIPPSAHISFIIIIINSSSSSSSKTALLEPQPSLLESARLSNSHFFGFHNTNFFLEQSHQP
jgi:hypothetical protein